MEQVLLTAVASVMLWSERVGLLCNTPAAEALSCDAVARLLQAAAQLGEDCIGTNHYSQCTQHFCQLPGALMLSREAIEPLVQTAVKRGEHNAARRLCGQPAGSGLQDQYGINHG
jgi:hypothetical protein